MKIKDLFVELMACPPFLLGKGETLKYGSMEEAFMLAAERSIGLISSSVFGHGEG